ncbi:DUF2254 domain-containing protein [Falsirhodobacter sp. 20TX0035]|uniref:DUF2254 domain-containing protein n=1 Tax=Falsirhodobacter sp. 20TX0035 TaxID=3022019 RepID=UPI00232B31D8|nr:DUF2254 domain-containing protein [Falsirhodobacter sp. 20TX0035]MDB6453270.1 DUF2254 domain-containing protein [Falsirhodobacter sp. 20TX0035]
MSRWKWVLTRLTRRLWLRTTLIGMLGIAVAILAAVVERFIPWTLPGKIGADAVGGLLNIIASSMLAVTTFSLSIVTAAYGSATSNVTPRATRLLIEDRVSQNALSTFIGSFLFAIVGLIVLPTGAYGERGRIVLFFFTIGIIGLIVISLLRWIDHLTRLGRVGETAGRVEAAAREAIERRLKNPYLGCQPYYDPPSHAHPILAHEVGYLQHIDTAALQAVANRLGCRIHVLKLPGAFIYRGTILGWATAEVEDALDAFTVGEERSFDQDPRFGLVVLAEVASRALSPAMNDSGTAIDIIGRITRLLTLWAEGPLDVEPQHDRVYMKALSDNDMLEDAFMVIARDGAAAVEIQIRLQKSLAALTELGSSEFRTAVALQSKLALQRGDALPLAAERQMLAAL